LSATTCDCGLCNPQSNTNPHPKWGYDLNAVPGHPCLMCGEPIGQEPYFEFTAWARFGQMFLIHERCRDSKKNMTKAGRNI
jgi:hypothetical protein